MNSYSKATPVLAERSKTVRQEIVDLLQEERMSVKDLSQMVRKSEKEIFEQLSHIQRSRRLKIEPAQCLICGFVFEKRDRPKRPGKCPKCRSTRISEPCFFIKC